LRVTESTGEENFRLLMVALAGLSGCHGLLSAVCCLLWSEKAAPSQKGRFPGRRQQNDFQFWHLSLQDLGIAVMKPRGRDGRKYTVDVN